MVESEYLIKLINQHLNPESEEEFEILLQAMDDLYHYPIGRSKEAEDIILSLFSIIDDDVENDYVQTLSTIILRKSTFIQKEAFYKLLIELVINKKKQVYYFFEQFLFRYFNVNKEFDEFIKALNSQNTSDKQYLEELFTSYQNRAIKAKHEGLYNIFKQIAPFIL